MTRLFPRPYEGLHPAFPPFEDPCLHTTPASLLITTTGGLIGAFSFPLAAIATIYTRAAAFSTKIAAYSFVASGIFAVVGEKGHGVRAHAFLAEKGIQVPPRQFYDRFDTFTSDDASLVGALGAVLVASGLRKPWGVTGWRRWVGAAAFGTLSGRLGFHVCYCGGSRTIMEQVLARDKARREQMRQYQDEVVQVSNARLQGRSSSARPQTSGSRVQDASSGPSETMLGKAHPDYQNTTPTILREDEGPHVTARQEGDGESRPIPATAYRWATTVSPERIVPELESHIEGLKQRRQSHAKEAELIWHWLAEKEGEYYRLCENSVGLDAEYQKQKLLIYISFLGVQHMSVWLAVSKMDWAIADAQKRIAQHKAQAQKDDRGEPGIWMPRAPSAQGAQAPETALKELRKSLVNLNEMHSKFDESTERTIRELETGVMDPTKPEMPPEIKDKLMSSPDWKGYIRGLAEQNKQNLLAEKEAVEAAISDGENRVKRLREGPGGK